MILLLGVVALSVAAGYILGGRLRTFEQIRLRWWALAPVGLALQVLPLPDLAGDVERLLGVVLLIISYVLLIGFVLQNLRLAGFPLLLVGLALNLAVISVNGGMPVGKHALLASGQGSSIVFLEQDPAAKHHLSGPDDLLTPLADVIAIRPPVAQVVSVGDLLVYAGLAWLVVAVMRGRTAEPVRPREPGRYRGKHRRTRYRKHESAMTSLPGFEATRSGTSP